MTKQLTITVDQLRESVACSKGWERVLEASNGVASDKPFPLSAVLNLKGLEDTLWCFKCLPDHRIILVKFALFCAKEVNVNSKDEQVINCIKVLEKYIEGNANADDLLAVGDASDTISDNPVFTAVYVATYADAYDVNVLAARVNAMPTAVKATICTVAYAVTATSVVDPEVEKQKQINYLRKLLDGEA